MAAQGGEITGRSPDDSIPVRLSEGHVTCGRCGDGIGGGEVEQLRWLANHRCAKAEKLTPADVQFMADVVARYSQSDAERAHSAEDDMCGKVLRAVADGTLTGDEARQAAAIAVRSLDTEMPRWYA